MDINQPDQIDLDEIVRVPLASATEFGCEGEYMKRLGNLDRHELMRHVAALRAEAERDLREADALTDDAVAKWIWGQIDIARAPVGVQGFIQCADISAMRGPYRLDRDLPKVREERDRRERHENRVNQLVQRIATMLEPAPTDIPF